MAPPGNPTTFAQGTTSTPSAGTGHSIVHPPTTVGSQPQRAPTEQEHIIKIRLDRAEAEYKSYVAELESLKNQMAELKKAKKGKGKSKRIGKRVAFAQLDPNVNYSHH